MEIKITDMEKETKKMISVLQGMGKAANDKCYDIVRQCTQKLDEAVVNRMPIDESFLESSTKTKMLKNADIAKITGVVYIPSNAPASDYALFMHEMTYALGERSQRKQDTSGVEVGPKYFERALKDSNKGFTTFIYQQLKGFIDNVK